MATDNGHGDDDADDDAAHDAADNASSFCTLKLVDPATGPRQGGMSRSGPLLSGSLAAMKSPAGFHGGGRTSIRGAQPNKRPAGANVFIRGNVGG